MNKERLLKLADFVEANAVDNTFNMTSYFSKNVRKPEDLQHNCGTTACLAGWGCLVPEFKQAGYHAELYEPARPDLGIIPVYGDFRMFEALKAFFDLKYSQSLYLFGEYADEDETVSRADEGVEQAVARIRDFVATGEMNWEEPDPDYDEDKED